MAMGQKMTARRKAAVVNWLRSSHAVACAAGETESQPAPASHARIAVCCTASHRRMHQSHRLSPRGAGREEEWGRRELSMTLMFCKRKSALVKNIKAAFQPQEGQAMH